MELRKYIIIGIIALVLILLLFNKQILPKPDEYPNATDNNDTESAECIEDDGGKDILTMGTVSLGTNNYVDKCKDNTTIYEYYCLDNVSVANETLHCPIDYYCAEGRCKPIQYDQTLECTDSDSGIEIYETGITKNNSDSEVDNCINTSEIREFYCSGFDVVSTVTVCPSGYGCEVDRCIALEAPPMTNSCSDSDGGDDPAIFGTVMLNGADAGSDNCLSAAELVEYYCTAENITTFRIIICPDLCSDGVCVIE